MAVDAKTRGLQVLETLYPDPTVRAARQEELGETGLVTLGSNVLRQDDYSRNMNELGTQRTAAETAAAEAKALYDSNKAWFDEKQAELAELVALRAKVAGNPNPDPNAPKAEPKYVTPEALADLERGAVAFMDELSDLKLQHFQQFGELLDARKLLQHPKVQQLGIRGVYAEVHKPQLDARAAKQAQEAEDKIRLDERTKVLAQSASQHHPYPIRGNEPSTLDRFERAPDQAPKVATVDDMANEYARLSAARGVSA